SSRRRHTRSKRDWSSDVCSSDLETDMPLLNDGDILTLPEIKEAKTVKIFTATGEEIKYFVYAPQMSIASLPGGFYTVYILNNAEIGRASCREKVKDVVVEESVKT